MRTLFSPRLVLSIFSLAVLSQAALAQEQIVAPENAAAPAAPATQQPIASDPDIEQLLKKIQGDSATPPPAAQPPVAQAPAASALSADMPAPVDPNVPVETPAQAQLAAPPLDGASDIPSIPVLPATEGAPEENLFFDSESLVPSGEMESIAPRKVNPALEPASKLIIVTKDYVAGSEHAKLISARRAVSLGRYDSALRIYNEMYEQNKRDPNVLLGRAIAYQKLGHTEDAIRAYNELLDIRPDNLEAQVNMLGLMGKRYPAVTMQRLQALSAEHPDDPGVLAQIATTQANLGRYDEAMASLGIVSGIDPNNASHVFNMAVIADRAGKKDEAIRYYEKALEVDTVYGAGRTIPREAALARLAQLR